MSWIEHHEKMLNTTYEKEPIQIIKCFFTSILPRSSDIKKTAVAPPGVEEEIDVGKSKLQNFL